MANTYTQIHIHAIFAVQFRFGLIQNDWKDELYKYITGIVQKQNHKMLCINGMPDHVHIFFGMRAVQSLSDLLQDIKSGSAGWINKCKLVRGRFQWQEGYGAFSYSKSQANDVIILGIRNPITVTSDFLMNTRNCLKILEWNMMEDTFLKSHNDASE